MKRLNIPPEMQLSLKTARNLNGYTQKEAAHAIGVSTDTLRNYEQGKSFPDIPTLKRIEALYNISYNQIIFLTGDHGLTEETAS